MKMTWTILTFEEEKTNFLKPESGSEKDQISFGAKLVDKIGPICSMMAPFPNNQCGNSKGSAM